MFIGFSETYVIGLIAAWTAILVALIAFVGCRPHRFRSPKARWGARLFLILWTSLTLAVLLETLFALFYDTTDSFALLKTSQRWNARHVQLNNWRYRDVKPFTAEVSSGRHRIALLGDSFAFGHGVKNPRDRFGDLLESKLRAATGGTWELYNLAFPGADTGSERITLEKLEAKSFRTDVVLLAYCLNDVDTLLPQTEAFSAKILFATPPNVIAGETYLGNFLYYRYRFLNLPEIRDYYGFVLDGYRGEIWQQQREQLRAIETWCSDRKIRLLVVIFPFLHSLGESYPFRPAHEQLAAFFRSEKIPYLDLLDIFEKHRDKRLVVNRFDAHPNEEAHRIAAEAIWKDLLKPVVEGGSSEEKSR